MKPSFLQVTALSSILAMPLSAGTPELQDKTSGHSFMEQNACIMTNINGRLTVDTLYGFTTARGYQFYKTPTGSHDLYFLTGWFYGTQDAHGDYDLRLSQEMLPFYMGYRYEWNINQKWTAYAGAHIGYLYSRSVQKASGEDEGKSFSQKLTTTSNSFAFGCSLGVNWQFSRDWALTAGYTFTEFMPIKRFTSDDPYPQNTKAMTGTVNLGLTMIFDDMSIGRKDSIESPWYFSGAMGMIHSNRGFVDNGDQWIASNLYGAGFIIAREVGKRDDLSERLGLKTGYYYGEGDDRYGTDWSDGDSYSIKNELHVIPLMLTYDWVYKLAPSFSISWGLSGGAIIQKTKFTLDSQLDGIDDAHARMDSTRVLPTIGMKLGIEVHISDRSSMFISYDFMQSFGNDCKTPSCTKEWYQDECNNVPKKNRYYGLVSAGMTYRF